MKSRLASIIGVNQLSIPGLVNRTGSLSWSFLCVTARWGWAGIVCITHSLENHSHLIHEWASTGRHAKGSINKNSENMIRQARNALQPIDRILMVASLCSIIFYPLYGCLLSAATFIVFFRNANKLNASSSVLGYLGMGVSGVLKVMLLAASLVSSNRWRKSQFRE